MFSRKGQSTVEYALIIAVVVAGLLFMQTYVKRGYAGKLKGSSDDMAEQYDPTAYTGAYNTHQESHVNQQVLNRLTSTIHVGDQVSDRKGSEVVSSWATGEDLYNK